VELEEFEKVVEHALATLPDFIRSKLQNIDIVIRPLPGSAFEKAGRLVRQCDAGQDYLIQEEHRADKQ
jgi:predicted Zn-dependent protease with MMP-like domain